MAELIPTMTVEQFQELSPDQLKRLKSCEVEFDGEYLFTFINPQTDYIRRHVEYLAQSGNDVGGEDLEKILVEVEA